MILKRKVSEAPEYLNHIHSHSAGEVPYSYFPGEMTTALSCLETSTGTQSRKQGLSTVPELLPFTRCVILNKLSSLSTHFFICKMEKPPFVMPRTSNEEMEWDELYKG